MRTWTACAIVMATVAVPAFGDTVNPIIFGDPDPVLNQGFYSDPGHSQLQGDNFVLAAGSNTVTDIHWWGYYELGDTIANDDFTVSFHEDSGGLPSADAFATVDASMVTRMATSEIISDATVYEYWLDIAPLELAAGETFYLSIVNDTSGDTDDWVWATTGTGDNFFRAADNEAWIQSSLGTDMAFYLTGTGPAVVPIPPAAAMGLFGFGLLAVLKRKSGRQAERTHQR